MTTDPPGFAELSSRLLQSLAINNAVRLNFPGIFMKLAGEFQSDEEITLDFDDGPLFRDGAGELNWPTLGVLLDIAMGSVTRPPLGPTLRPATVHLQIHMTGASTRGRVSTGGRLVGLSQRSALPHVLTTGTLSADGAVVAHASGEFVMIELPPGTTQAVMPWVPEGVDVPPLEIDNLEDEERRALDECRRAAAAATDEHPFIEHFWCGVPEAGDGEAHLHVRVTPHLGNRIGHMHGGVLLGMAAQVAIAAAPAEMRLSNINVWYISPGQPPTVDVRSTVVQKGRNLALVRTQILSASGKVVLEGMSQHIKT